MTNDQMVTFAAHIRSNTDAAVVAALSERRDDVVAAWYNDYSITLAWRTDVPKQDLFEAMNLATFDTVSAGKRDAWGIVLDAAPIDATRNKLRKGILDIFSSKDATTMLTACTEYVRQFELVFGGAERTTGEVTAVVRNLIGSVSVNEVSKVLNEF